MLFNVYFAPFRFELSHLTVTPANYTLGTKLWQNFQRHNNMLRLKRRNNYINGLVQDCSNFIANAMELL